MYSTNKKLNAEAYIQHQTDAMLHTEGDRLEINPNMFSNPAPLIEPFNWTNSRYVSWIRPINRGMYNAVRASQRFVKKNRYR